MTSGNRATDGRGERAEPALFRQTQAGYRDSLARLTAMYNVLVSDMLSEHGPLRELVYTRLGVEGRGRGQISATGLSAKADAGRRFDGVAEIESMDAARAAC